MKKEHEHEASKIKEIQGYFKEKKNRGQIIAVAAACLVVMVICVVALAQGLRRGAANGSLDLVETQPEPSSPPVELAVTTTEQQTEAESTTGDEQTTSALTNALSSAAVTGGLTPKPSLSATASASPKPTSASPKPTSSSSTTTGSGNYVLVVYKGGTQTVVAYEADKNGNYDASKPVRKMICSTGSSGPTPNGTFKISQKIRYHRLEGARGQYCSRFNGGILFHSVPILESASTVDQGKKLMNLTSYAKLGRAASHGCVRLLVKDAKWIYDNCKIGTRVIVTSSKSPVGTGSKPAIIRKAPYSSGNYGWDPTDPDPENPYRNGWTHVSSVKLNKTSGTLKTGETLQLRATISPSDAMDDSVTWSSSNKDVATVSSNGLVTAKGPGTAVITVKSNDGGKTATCTITVEEVTSPTETTTTTTTTPADTTTTTTTTTPADTTTTTTTTPADTTTTTTTTTPADTTTTTLTQEETEP